MYISLFINYFIKYICIYLKKKTRKEGYTGKVMFNDQERCYITERSCYIMQEDNLHPLLTVKEIMYMAAALKLGFQHSVKFRSKRVIQKIKIKLLYLSLRYLNLSSHNDNFIIVRR